MLRGGGFWLLCPLTVGCDFIFGDVFIVESPSRIQAEAGKNETPIEAGSRQDASRPGVADADTRADAESPPVGPADPPTDGGPRADAGPDAAPQPVPCHLGGCNGFYVGRTDQGEPIRFEVRDNGLASVLLGWKVPACSLVGMVTTAFSLPEPIDSQGFVSTGRQNDGSVSYELGVNFAKSARASGTVQLEHNDGKFCNEKLLPFRWTAERSTCGDGTVDWPETCEDTPQPSQRCSSTCQLTPAAEIEPNNDGLAANGPGTGDGVWFGALPSGDADFYELRNPSTQALDVTLTVHGSVMGTCGIDSEICLLNTFGTPLLSECRNSGHIGGCPAVSWTIQPSGRIFAVIQGKGAVAGYRLHVDYEDQ